MSEHHAPFWIYGTGRLRLGVSSPGALPARFGVDGRRAADPVVSRRQTVVLPLRGRGWHLITVDTRSLHESGGRMVGLELHSATLG
jgi:hypothetical protein